MATDGDPVTEPIAVPDEAAALALGEAMLAAHRQPSGREGLAAALYAAWSRWRIEEEGIRSPLWWCTRDDQKAEFYAAADRILAWKPTDDDG